VDGSFGRHVVQHCGGVRTNGELHGQATNYICTKTIFKTIWTFGIQLLGTASTSNIEILERFQSKALRMIVDAPWYVPNTLVRRDLQIPSVK
jgi:hypothetical protein